MQMQIRIIYTVVIKRNYKKSEKSQNDRKISSIKW